ncbi:MAG: pyridoxamine 5'-phosphate oxidase family protein [Actinobacteria bacterium]|nr:pyridoxamine 5'-phosphate oxidase family protein [Actinomycetota bacterium]
MSDLSEVAPAFVTMAHRIVWCTAATVDRSGAPRTRVLHPVWEWDGGALRGWIATSPLSLKARHLAAPGGNRLSLTYWAPDHDTCTADCDVEWESTPEQRAAGWQRFADAPAPVGYDPSIIPGWDSPDSPAFGIIRLQPHRLRVMPGSLMMQGTGQLLTWSDG